MKAVILAGGTGTRLMPLTKVTNKHLLPVGDKPMIFHSLEKVREAGIRDVLVVTGIDHMGDIVRLIGSGSDFNLSVTYRVQDKPDGIAGALDLARDFVGDSKFVVILADNIFRSSIAKHARKFSDSRPGSCMLLLKEVENPQRFGVATVLNGAIQKIVEKPKNPESNLCITGIYFFDGSVFEKISRIQPSHRGELEISDVNQMFVEEGSCLYDVLEGWWTDAGTLSSYNSACQLSWELSCRD
jgi:glucose-1-phosphate thymidylyltransferase